uniref:Uncharacterized protein n=1 Tax=Phlebotomus papatasi TaxID=29031 RepID=A0A1B0GQ07_PHLPP
MEEMRKTLPTLPITERQDRSKRRATRDHSGDKVTEVRACQGKIPRVSQRRLKIWRSHESTNIENDPDMSVEGQNDGQDNEQCHNGHLIWHNSRRFARAVVKTQAKYKLQPRRCPTDKPNEQENHRCGGLVEPEESHLRLTESERTLTRNAHAARNHWNLQTDRESSIPAKRRIVDDGIRRLVTRRSARATLTIKAFPVKKFNQNPHTNSRILYNTAWFGLSKSCIHNVVYCLTNRHFRNAYVSLFHYCCCKTNVSTARRNRAAEVARPAADVRVHIIPGYNMYSYTGPQRNYHWYWGKRLAQREL